MSTKSDRLADSNKGAQELDVLMTALRGQDWIPEGNGWSWSDEEYAEWEQRQLERLHAEMDREHETFRQSHLTLQKVRRVLRDFAKASVTLSSLQPVLELAHELNPSLQDELSHEGNPFY